MATSDSPLNVPNVTLSVAVAQASQPQPQPPSDFSAFLASFASEQVVPDFSSATHYADPTATSNGSGTLASPWTFEQAMANAVAGNVVGLLPGKWYGSNTSGYTNEAKRLYPAFRPANSGTASNPIWFVAQYPAATNSVNRTEIYSGGSAEWSSWPAFGSYQKDYIRYSGIYSNENEPNGQIINDSGLATVRDGAGCGVHKCHLVGKPNPNDNNAGVRIEFMDFSDVADNVIEGFRGDANNPGITIYKVTGLRIHHNDISDCEYGWQSKIKPTGYLAYNNKVTGCFQSFRLHSPGYASDTDQAWIYNNTFDTNGYIYEVTTSLGDLILSGSRIFNNTFYNMQNANDPAALWWAAPIYDEVRDNVFYNNIVHTAYAFMGSYQSSPSTVERMAKYMKSNRNVFYGLTAFFNSGGMNPHTLADWQAIGRDVDSVTTDPLLTNASTGDFTLQQGSPAIGLGIDTYGRFGAAGAVINAGAYPVGSDVIGVRA